MIDAPWIVEAERYGEPDMTSQEWNSYAVKDAVASDLKKARDMIQKAVAILEATPEDTVWEDEIIEAADTASDLGFRLDALANKAERW